jgi:hypothetical protein
MCKKKLIFKLKFLKTIGVKNTKLNSGYNCFWILLPWLHPTLYYNKSYYIRDSMDKNLKIFIET